jgi:hypothetical protein
MAYSVELAESADRELDKLLKSYRILSNRQIRWFLFKIVQNLLWAARSFASRFSELATDAPTIPLLLRAAMARIRRVRAHAGDAICGTVRLRQVRTAKQALGRGILQGYARRRPLP